MTHATLPAYLVRPAATRVRRPLRPDLTPVVLPEPAPTRQAPADAALTRSPVRLASSAADLAPPPMRPGAEACLAIPSRMGDTLRYRDGRVTDMQGRPIEQPAAAPAAPSTNGFLGIRRHYLRG